MADDGKPTSLSLCGNMWYCANKFAHFHTSPHRLRLCHHPTKENRGTHLRCGCADFSIVYCSTLRSALKGVRASSQLRCDLRPRLWVRGERNESFSLFLFSMADDGNFDKKPPCGTRREVAVYNIYQPLSAGLEDAAGHGAIDILALAIVGINRIESAFDFGDCILANTLL